MRSLSPVITPPGRDYRVGRTFPSRPRPGVCTGDRASGLESGETFLDLGGTVADDDVRVHREEPLELAGAVHGTDADRHAGLVQRIDEVVGEDETLEGDPVDISIQDPLHECF